MSYIVAEGWEHIFDGVAPQKLSCRWVYDLSHGAMIYVEICVNNVWERASRDDAMDIAESVEDANSEGLVDPDAYGLLRLDTPPAWCPASAVIAK